MSRGGRGGSFDSLVNPAEFPARAGDLDTESIRQAAQDLRDYGTSLTTNMDAIASAWNGLAGCYVAPESHQVLNLMGPAQVEARTVDDVFAGVARQLDSYADDLDVFKPRLADFERRAQEFRDAVKDGVEVSALEEQGFFGAINVVGHAARALGADDTITIPWREHGPTVDQNTELLGEYDRLLADLSKCATDTANAIRRTHDLGSTLYASGPYAPITSEQIAASGNLGWGEPVSQDRNLAEQISDGIGDFGGGLVFGITSLAGFHPDGGWAWSAEEMRQSWGGLANLADALTMTVVLAPVTALGEYSFTGLPGADQLGQVPLVAQQRERLLTLRDTGAAMIGYDPHAEDGDGWHAWKEEPWRASTSTLLNIGTLFVGGTGAAGAGARSAAGARAAGVAATAAEVLIPGGSWAVKSTLTAVRGTTTILKAEPWATAVARATGRNLNASIPQVTVHTPNSGIVQHAPVSASIPSHDAKPSNVVSPLYRRESLTGDVEGREPVLVGSRTGNTSAQGTATGPDTPSIGGRGTTGADAGGTPRSGDQHPNDSPGSGDASQGPGAADAGQPSGFGDEPSVRPGGGQGWPQSPRDYSRPEVGQVVTVEGKDLPGPRTAFTASRFAQGGLQPNTLYHVEGRGDFYTNADSIIDYVETTYGGSTLNWDLHDPQKNTTYVVHPEVRYPSEGPSYAHVFVTDDEGRTILAHTDRLSRGNGIRSESVQARIGAQGGPGYDGGHSYGTEFGGGGEYLNLTAQLREINQNFPNSFYQLEAQWRQLLPDTPGPHPVIEVNIHKTYEPGNPVPLEYLVEYRVDGGDPIRRRFKNV